MWREEEQRIRQIKIIMSTYLCRNVCYQHAQCQIIKNHNNKLKCRIYKRIYDEFAKHNFSTAFPKVLIRNCYDYFMNTENFME